MSRTGNATAFCWAHVLLEAANSVTTVSNPQTGAYNVLRARLDWNAVVRDVIPPRLPSLVRVGAFVRKGAMTSAAECLPHLFEQDLGLPYKGAAIEVGPLAAGRRLSLSLSQKSRFLKCACGRTAQHARR